MTCLILEIQLFDRVVIKEVKTKCINDSLIMYLSNGGEPSPDNGEGSSFFLCF